MIRMIVYVAIALALAFGVIQLADTPGHLTLSYGGFEYQVSLLKAFLGLLVLTIALILFWSLLRLVLRLPGMLSLSNRMRKRARGYAAVQRGMISVGAGDRRGAERHAGEAEKLLGGEPLTLLLRAQTAQLSGDRQAAEKSFTRMLDDPETRVVGLRGLYVEARRRGSDTARTYVEEAWRAAPAAPWAAEAMLEYRSADRDWAGAAAVVDQNASRRVIAREDAKRQKAVLQAAEALDLADKAPDEALAAAQRALKLDAGLVPAATLVARRASAKGDYRAATKVIEAAWRINTHPDLADAYLGVRVGDSTHDRLKRARQLLKLTPKDREARLTMARAAIEAREFAEARPLLEALVLEQPTARACLLMAELEDKDHGDTGAVRKWLARASYAPRDPAWVADGFVAERWAPVSPVTGKLDAFVWTTPPQSLESSVRASIDADRFAEAEPAPERAVLPPPAPVVIEPAPVEAEVTAAPAKSEAPAEAKKSEPAKTEAARPEPAVSEPAKSEPAKPETAVADEPVSTLVHAPDDPGPRGPADGERKRWRLFG